MSTPTDIKNVEHDAEREIHPLAASFLSKIEKELTTAEQLTFAEIEHVMAVLKKHL